MAALNRSYCGVCSRDLDDEILNDGEFMIQCDVCETWYHGRCVELEEFEAADIDDYHCPSCLPQAGPSRQKRVCNIHRYDYSDSDATNKATENGTKRFVDELKKRKFPDTGKDVVIFEEGHSLSSYLDETNFRSPILIKNAVGLGLVLPPPTFTADDVEKRVGGDRYVDVVDVYTQHSYKMRLRTFLNFFRQQNRPKLYNLISLEFSDTELSKLVKTPDVVDELSWVEQYWPKPLRDDLSTAQKAVLNEHITARPEVSKFCLIGMAESYTDFHIDFGGTSVFYHILSGEKVFYLIEPSETNLRLFENWQRSPSISETFFGDLVGKCSQLVLKPGQTFFIPTGWIHAVYTPKDSLVIGGNFLHSFNIGLQIRIYEMEKRANTADKFMFPHFELMNWYAGVHFLDFLKDLNEEKSAAKPYLLDGLKSMIFNMKTWIQRNQAHVRRSKLSGQIIIETMTCSQVLKQLERAVRTNEKMAAPAKAKRKKRVDVYAKVKQPPPIIKESIPSTSATLGPIKVALPLPKLKVPSKDALERTKGCPKSPAKIQQQAADIVNAVAAAVPNSQEKEKRNSPSQATKKSRLKKMTITGEIESNGLVADKSISSTSIDRQQISDVSSRGDLDSAPPTPGWSEDADESGDRSESVIKDEKTTPIRKSVERNRSIDRDSVDRSIGSKPQLNNGNETSIDNRIADEVKRADTPEKKVFGFSLLDMQFNDPKSPISPPPSSIVNGKETSNSISSPPSSSSIVSPFKLDSKMSLEKASQPVVQQISLHGRVQKPNQRVLGKKSKTEFFPDLGYCRQDDEFVYPSLSDSEPNETSPKKKRKPAVIEEKSPKEAERDCPKVKLDLSILTTKKQKPKKEGPVKEKKEKKSKAAKAKPVATVPANETDNQTKVKTEPAKSSTTTASAKPKKMPKGTTKQRLANKLKIRKLIPM